MVKKNVFLPLKNSREIRYIKYDAHSVFIRRTNDKMCKK